MDEGVTKEPVKFLNRIIKIRALGQHHIYILKIFIGLYFFNFFVNNMYVWSRPMHQKKCLPRPAGRAGALLLAGI